MDVMFTGPLSLTSVNIRFTTVQAFAQRCFSRVARWARIRRGLPERLFRKASPPVQGGDRRGPTAVLKAASRKEHVRTGGTLLDQKFTPALLADETGLDDLVGLVRSDFKLDEHHIQFNVVHAETLRKAQKNPENCRDLIVREAGYRDYFCDLNEALQNGIIPRTEHQGV